jgi:hypothetical protein
MRSTKIFLGCSGALLITFVLGVLVIDRIFIRVFPVKTSVTSAIQSPRSAYVATVYQSHCFVSPGWTAVNLRDASSPFTRNDGANDVYILEDLRDISVEWVSPKSLLLSTELWVSDPRGGPRPIRRLNTWRGIRIAYETRRAKSAVRNRSDRDPAR